MPDRTLSILLISLTLVGCSQAVPEPGAPQTDTVVLSDEAADSAEQLRVRADGMTIWAEPQVLSANTWLFRARSSYTLADVDARIASDDARAELVSARKFEVRLTAQQMEDNLGGVPLIVRLTTASGLEYHAMLGARARFEGSTGSSKLYPWKNITPIAVAGERIFRGRVTTPDDFVMVAGWNDDDSEPIVSREDDQHWLFDWYPGRLMWAAHPTEDALEIVGDDADGTRYRRSAPILMKISRMGVTNEDPADAWPVPSCETDTRTCLADYDLATDDLETCGSWAEVAPCLDEETDDPDDTEAWVQRFATDLRHAVIDHYAEHGDDIVASGGNTRPQALLAVDSAQIEEVDDPEAVPSGHDLQTHRVFTHPDVTFPGSDIVWFGVYDREDGELIEVYSFN